MNRKEPAESIEGYDVYCPHCGLEQAENAENFCHYSNDDDEYGCDECEKLFTVIRNVVTTYITVRVEKKDPKVREYRVDLLTGKKVYTDEANN